MKWLNNLLTNSKSFFQFINDVIRFNFAVPSCQATKQAFFEIRIID